MRSMVRDGSLMTIRIIISVSKDINHSVKNISKKNPAIKDPDAIWIEFVKLQVIFAYLPKKKQ